MANGQQRYQPRNQPPRQQAPPVQQQTEDVTPGQRPDIRIMQPEKDQNGVTIWRSVGGMWAKTSESGKPMWNLRIGNLRLVAFPNDNQENQQ